jgi:hypothetical protein
VEIRIRVGTVDAEVVVLAAELDAERRIERRVGLRRPAAAGIDVEPEGAAADRHEETFPAMLLRHPRQGEAQRALDLDRVALELPRQRAHLDREHAL